mmetsp:Transcript_34679/g.54163  ORF Transcript_34679/g.54163 Transcript_34679/m.54163 type:complete len:128 (+) Transcript_34679:77-460(+)
MVDGTQVDAMGHELTELICGPPKTWVELLVERDGDMIPPIRIMRDYADHVTQGSSYKRLSQPYEEIPYYLSERDKANAQDEAAERIREIRNAVYAGFDNRVEALPVPHPDASSAMAMYRDETPGTQI